MSQEESPPGEGGGARVIHLTERAPYDRHNLAAEAERMIAAVQRPDWALSLDSKLKTVQWVQHYQKLVPKSQFESLVTALCGALGWTRERTARLLLIEAPEQARRALMAQPITLLRLPEEEVYPKTGWIGNYLLYAQNSEVPLGWHFWTAVAMIGASCRRNIYLDRSNSFVWPNHYIILVGRTGLKKTTAITTGLELLQDMNILLERSDHQPLRLLPEKLTPERFLSLLKSQPLGYTPVSLTKVKERWSDSAGVFTVDELVTLFSKEAFHSGAMVQVLTALYGCPSYWVSGTVGRGEDILRNVSITFLAGTTLEWIRSSMTDDAAHGGFMGRCVIAHRRECLRSFPKPEVLDPIVRQTLAEQLLNLATAENTMMSVRPEAEAMYVDYHEAFAQKVAEDSRLSGYFARKGHHLWKLAMVLALSQDRREITPSDLELADSILTTEETTQAEFYSKLGTHAESDRADRVLQVIEAAGGTMLENHIITKCRRFTGSITALRGLLNTLVAANELSVEFDARRRQQRYRKVIQRG